MAATSRDLFNFWKISDNISKTVQDSLLNSNRKSYALYRMVMLRMTLGNLFSTLNHLNFNIFYRLLHRRNWWSQRLQIWCKGWMCKSQPTDDKPSLIRAWSFVKFWIQVGYINSSNKTTYHPQKGRNYGHMTVSKFCRLPWCSASRGLSETAELGLLVIRYSKFVVKLFSSLTKTDRSYRIEVPVLYHMQFHGDYVFAPIEF